MRLGVESLETRLVPATTLVQDINPGPPSSNPNNGVNSQGLLLFVADDGVHGNEVWKSDGTPGAASMIADINPTGSSNPQDLTDLNGSVFFSANDGVHGSELWMYDGNTQTTTMVLDINPNGSSDPQNITGLGGQIFFTADDGVHGRELWVSDGTAAGTQMVKDINPGSPSSSPGSLAVFNSEVYFSADDGVHGRELWASDGTAANTTMIADIVPGSGSGNPNQLTAVGTTLYFVATTPAAGTELWQSDGSTHTQLTADIFPGASSSSPINLTNVQDTSLFFSADDGSHGRELWQSVAGSNTASIVSDIFPGPASSNPSNLIDQFGNVLFIADDGVHGAQLWHADGNPADTGLVALINTGGDAFQRLPSGQFNGPMVLSSGFLVFTANDGVHGFEPWISDGTASGTFQVQDLNPGSASSSPTAYTDVFGTVFFSADDGSTGFELHSLTALPRANVSIAFSNTPSSSVAGQAVTLSVDVTAPAAGLPVPTGRVDFSDGAGNYYGAGTLDANGHATLTTTILPVGMSSIVVTYNGDINYAPAQAIADQTVDGGTTASSTTTLTTNPNPSTVGQSVTLTATVTSTTTTPTGSVVFFDGSTILGEAPLNGAGVAALPVPNWTAGTHALAAVYEGDANFANSRGTLTQDVNPPTAAVSTTTVSGTPNPSTQGQSVTITATVTSVSGTPSGVVTFTSGGFNLGSASLDVNGIATLMVSSLLQGPSSITATYGGSSQFLSSSGSYTQQVNASTAPATTTIVSGTPNPSTFGQSVTFTATVTSAAGTPTGSVAFLDGANPLGTFTLDANGKATLSIATLTFGPHTITANFLANASFAASSNNTNQVVNAAAPATTTTTISGTPNPSTFGQSVTVTANVRSAAGTPTGSVAFLDGANPLGTFTLDANGKATLSIATLTFGPHTITANFLANASFAASSNNTNQVVNAAAPATTTTTISGTPNPSTFGQSVTFTATVTSAAGTPTGSVAFLDGANPLGTFTLDANGKATLSIATLTFGPHTITANFLANASFAASSNNTNQVVNAAAPTTTTTIVSGTPNPSIQGQTVTFTATVTSDGRHADRQRRLPRRANPLGTFTLDANGKATLPIATLTFGPHTITANFLANASFAASSNNTNQVVNAAAPATTTTIVSGTPNPSIQGQTVTFTATVTSTGGTPTGSVAFLDGANPLGTFTLDANGKATLSIATLTFGPHTITANFLANASFAASSNNTNQVVNAAAPTTTTTIVSGTPNPSIQGQTVTFTATVTSTGGTPTGSVAFLDGANPLGTFTLDANGKATLSIATLTFGPHTITANFLANASFAASSNNTNQVVNAAAPATTTTTISGTPNPSTFGQSVTFTATVTSTGGTPTGTVNFTEGATPLGSGTLDGTGHATLQISSLLAGSHTITATYVGTANFAGSAGNATQSNVNTPPATSSSLAISPTPAVAGQPITFTLTVTSTAGTPSGVVNFIDGSTSLGSVPLNGNGQAVLQVPSLVAGTHNITASFVGNLSFAGSSSSVQLAVQNAVTPSNNNYVTALYRDLLNRTPDAAGFAGWVGLLNNGGSRTFVASSFEQSPERRTLVINSVYEATLVRAPDPIGFANSYQLLQAGITARQLQALLQASPEYMLRRAGNTQAGFLNSIYLDSLGRVPEASAQAAYLPLLNAGLSHLQLAMSVATSVEADSRFVQIVYSTFLGRTAEAAGLQSWVDLLVRGGKDDQVVAGILGSDEYFQESSGM